MLDHFVHSPTGTKELALRATPKQAKRFELFTLKRDDITRLLNKGVETMELSKKDPYFKKMAMAHAEKQRQYRLLHPGVQRTDDLLDKLKPTDIKNVNKKDFEAVHNMYKTLDDRYYKARGSVLNQMEVAVKRQIMKEIEVKKAEKVLENTEEAQKIKNIQKDLSNSPRLKLTEFDIRDFEHHSQRNFDDHMHSEYNAIKRSERERFALSQLKPSKVSRQFLAEVEQIRAEKAKSIVGDHSVFLKKEPRNYVLSPSQMGLSAKPSEILTQVRMKNSFRNFDFGVESPAAPSSVLPSIKNSVNLNAESLREMREMTI